MSKPDFAAARHLSSLARDLLHQTRRQAKLAVRAVREGTPLRVVWIQVCGNQEHRDAECGESGGGGRDRSGVGEG